MSSGPEINSAIDKGTFSVPMPLFPERRLAKRLQADNPAHLDQVVEIIRNGGAVAFPFKGIYGVFGDADIVEATDLILKAKLRPEDKKLIIVPLPEHIDEIADLHRPKIDKGNLEALWRKIHALGIILHAATTAPYHLVQRRDDNVSTTLSIWAECASMRYTVESIRKSGGRALVGTSANKSGEATHWKYESLWEDFKYDVDAVVSAAPDPDFKELPVLRRKSTTVIDLTGEFPRLHRYGNVTEYEIRRLLRKFNFPKMTVGRDLISVRAREYPPEAPAMAV